MNDHSRHGAAIEAAAERWLSARGLRAVARNFRCKIGEIDLVMLDGQQLVFVEVRFRRDDRYGGAAASVTPAKQQRLIAAAHVFIESQPRWRNAPCRFDVLAGCAAPDTEPAADDPTAISWQWLRDAFGA